MTPALPTSHLGCTVRGCGLLLEPSDRRYVCPRGHSYDVARSGYLNLLQPQDRRSRSPGDSKAAVRTRVGLLEKGVGRAILDGFVQRASELQLGVRPLVADLGSGTGDTLGTLSRARPITPIGIDLSVFAADCAARRFPALTWVVANADRRLPLMDGDVDLVLSLHGRRNPSECARVLRPTGLLLIAVPAHDDLVELRALIHGERLERDRAETLLAAYEPAFRLLEHWSLRDRQHLAREALLDLLRITYRGERTSMSRRVAGLGALEVTFASDVFLLAPRPKPLT